MARLSGCFRLNRVIIIVASGTEKGSTVKAGSGNRVIKDAEDGVGIVDGRSSEFAWEL